MPTEHRLVGAVRMVVPITSIFSMRWWGSLEFLVCDSLSWAYLPFFVDGSADII